jgi:capsular polysaccharide transport system permease protein
MKLSPPTRPSESLASTGLAPPVGRLPDPPDRRRQRRRLRLRDWFMLLVLLPTAIAAAYFYVVAAPIYESEARFLVRGRGGGGGGGLDAGAGGGSGRAAAMAGIFAGARPGAEEARAVISYLDSYAAVLDARAEADLIELWRRPEADRLARLWWEEPQLEWLAWYFRRMIRTTFDAETNVLTLKVHAFRPADAQDLAERMLRLSEGLVNQLSERSTQDAIRVAQEDVRKAEERVAAAREAMIAFREREQAFDPTRTAAGAVETIGRLEALLAQTRTELEERRRFMRADNPQIQVLQNRISALQQQIATERGRVTRGNEALTQQVAGQERLELEKAFADRQLASATATLEEARSNALRQQIFLVRVADPQLPEYALFPRATFNTLTIFISLSVMFGIGWLLVVSAREHAS